MGKTAVVTALVLAALAGVVSLAPPAGRLLVGVVVFAALPPAGAQYADPYARHMEWIGHAQGTMPPHGHPQSIWNGAMVLIQDDLRGPGTSNSYTEFCFRRGLEDYARLTTVDHWPAADNTWRRNGFPLRSEQQDGVAIAYTAQDVRTRDVGFYPCTVQECQELVLRGAVRPQIPVECLWVHHYSVRAYESMRRQNQRLADQEAAQRRQDELARNLSLIHI